MSSVDRLERAIGYSFADAALLQLALTHRSFAGNNNERLEFLGDGLLNMIAAEALYLKFPSAREGQLSRLRARLVKGDTLAEIAFTFRLGDYIHLGSGELKSGGFRRESILADALEAIIGAVYLDAGFDACKQCVLRWLAPLMVDLTLADPLKDAKTRLQEYLQSRSLPLPQYEVTKVTGEAHQQTFYVECRIGDAADNTSGVGRSRRIAEQEAAAIALEKLGVKPNA